MSATTILAAIETAIENIVTGEVSSATIEGETFTTHNLKDLLALRDKYAADVAAATAVADSAAPFGITGLSAGSGK